MNKLARSITLSSAIALALTAGLASPALAADSTTYSPSYGPSTPTSQATTSALASATVKGGYLSETTDNHIYLGDTTLDGKSVQYSSGTTGWSITDARGTGASWALTVSATNFTSTPDTAAGTTDNKLRIIEAKNLSVACASGVPQSGSDQTDLPCSARTLGLLGQTVITTNGGEAKGTYNFNPTFTLQIPVNAYRSNYKLDNTTLIPYLSTVTYTLG